MIRRGGAGREGTDILQQGYAPLIYGARGGTPPPVEDGSIPNCPGPDRKERRRRRHYV